MLDQHFNHQWNLRGLIFCHALAFMILFSWLYPWTRQYWDQIDHWFFFALNGSLQQGFEWRGFWALANMRSSDLLPAVVMMCMLLKTGWIFNRETIQIGIIGFLIALVFLLFARFFLSTMADIWQWSNKSPSLVLEPSYRLIEMFPQWDTKDRANHSFPGDHSAVLLLWSMYITWHRPGKWACLALGLALLFMLPRWVAGAHWFSDSAVGGVFIALLAFSWYAHTPWTWAVSEKLLPIIYRVLATVVKIHPSLARWPIFHIRSG